MRDLENQVYEQLMQELADGELVLPTLPEVALRVRDAIEDDDVTTGQLAKILSTDAALCARIIQIANSAMIGGGKRVETVEQAIMRMGNRALRNMVTSVIMQQMFQATTDATDQMLREVWSHSSMVAAICSSLASFANLKPDQAMLAGLVHDIGALPVLKKAEDYPELTRNVAVLNRLVSRLHVPIGTAILKAWNFPPELVTVAAEHETVDRNNGSNMADYTDLVIVANLQSHQGTEHPLACTDWTQVPAFTRLGFAPETYEIEMENESEKIAAVKSALCT